MAKIEVRCSDEEKAIWREKAKSADISISELVRKSLGRVQSWTPANRQIEQAKLREIAKIGNNLNQIAKWANTHKSKTAAVQVVSHLAALEVAVQQLLGANPDDG